MVESSYFYIVVDWQGCHLPLPCMSRQAVSTMLESFLSGVGRALVTAELNTEHAIHHSCASCQQCRPAAPEALAATAYHDHTVKLPSRLPSRFVGHADCFVRHEAFKQQQH